MAVSPALTADRSLFLLSCLHRLWRDEDGQDAVEYALLAAFVGLAGYLVLPVVSGTVGAAYAAWLNPTAGVPSLWIPNEPTSGGS